MTNATANSPALATAPASDPWQQLLRVSAAGTILLSIAHQVLNRFFGISLVVLAVLLAAGLLLELTERRAGRVLLAATSVLFLGLHAAILVLVIRYANMAETFITASGLVVGLALTLAASIATIRRPRVRSERSARTAKVLGAVAGAAWIAAGLYSITARVGIENVQPNPSDLVVDVSDGADTAPDVDLPPGQTAVVFHNLDDSPLVIESSGADLHLAIPAHYSRRVNLDLDQGTHRYTIDGPDRRVTGTLTVG